MVVTNRLPPKHSPVGRTIGGYVVESLLGEGGMGAVYVAFNALLDKRAAIKIISQEYTSDRDVIARFAREAKAAAAIDDPNIIDVYDAGELPEDGMTYILMPLREGVSLEKLCAELGPLPLEVAGVIALQIASGLAAVHAVGIVHRDIKPQNILISRRQQRRYYVTIVDFGIAKLLSKHLQDPNFRTRTKSVLGTVGYMSPEQARGASDVDVRADLYSLGTVLYRMLAGRAPYEDPTIFGLLEKQAKEEPFPRPRELRPDIPEAWEALILDCLRKERDRRPATMHDFAHRLASGLSNGETLMRTLAPRFCTDVALGPRDATLNGDLETSIRRWSSASTQPAATTRRRRVAALAVAVLAGATAGSVAVGGALYQSDPANEKTPATAARRASTEATVVRPDPSGAKSPSDRAGASGGATPGSNAVGEAGGSSAPPPPAEPQRQDAPRKSSPELQVASGSAPAPRTPPPPPRRVAIGQGAGSATRVAVDLSTSAAAVPQPGTLVVKVKPWAEVWIDGQLVGQTPVRRSVTGGAHRVRIVGADKREDVDVTVQPGKETTIQRTW